jgi:Na+/H+ antiporter NhaC
MNNILFLIFLVLSLQLVAAQEFEVEYPEFIVSGIKTEIQLTTTEINWQDTLVKASFNQVSQEIQFKSGKATLHVKNLKTQEQVVKVGEFEHRKKTNVIPLWLSVLPPLLAIALALIFKEVIISLLFGVLSGVLILYTFTFGGGGIITGFLAVIDRYIFRSIIDEGHMSIILFSLMIGGTVAVISRNGGMNGAVKIIAKYATNAKSGQFATWILGVSIFFDDYANTLVVGNTMRPLTDKLKISREKLAYIVDSTAAPVAAIAFITTWIGAELSYIEGGIDKIGMDLNAYAVFFNSLQYSFYPYFTLAFILMIIFSGRDFGPMLKFENKARKGEYSLMEGEKTSEVEELNPKEGTKPNLWNALIPILVIIFGTLIGLYYTGLQATPVDDIEGFAFLKKLSVIIGNADSYTTLLWSSFAGLITATLMSVLKKILGIGETVEAIMQGVKTMISTIVILILAWSLALVAEQIHTAEFITQILGDTIPYFLIPALTFVLAAAVAFSTGSSWGTMAILYPIMIPATWTIAKAAGVEEPMALELLYNTVSCVLAGSVLGDHCSPISDTTILSSLSTSCNHINHVRTQLPYALIVGAVAILIGTIPGALGVSSFITIPVGFGVLFLIVKFLGKKVVEVT